MHLIPFFVSFVCFVTINTKHKNINTFYFNFLYLLSVLYWSIWNTSFLLLRQSASFIIIFIKAQEHWYTYCLVAFVRLILEEFVWFLTLWNNTKYNIVDTFRRFFEIFVCWCFESFDCFLSINTKHKIMKTFFIILYHVFVWYWI